MGLEVGGEGAWCSRSLTHSLTHSTQYPRRVAIAVWGYLTDGYALPEATMKELFHDYEGESTTVICMGVNYEGLGVWVA